MIRYATARDSRGVRRKCPNVTCRDAPARFLVPPAPPTVAAVRRKLRPRHAIGTLHGVDLWFGLVLAAIAATFVAHAPYAPVWFLLIAPFSIAFAATVRSLVSIRYYTLAHLTAFLDDALCPCCGTPIPELASSTANDAVCSGCTAAWPTQVALRAGFIRLDDPAGLRSQSHLAHPLALVLISAGVCVLSTRSRFPGNVVVGMLGLTICFVFAAVSAYRRRELTFPLVIAAAVPPMALSFWTLLGIGRTPDMTLATLTVALPAVVWAAAWASGRVPHPADPTGRGLQCAACGYDLRALSTQVPCPECGATVRRG